MAAAQTIVQFNYESSKAEYMALVKKYFDEDSTHSEATVQRTIEILKGSAKSHLHKHYEISYSFGREILMEKMQPPAEPVQVLTYEDVFDIFIKYHISNNHTGGKQHLLEVENNFRCAYNYPNVCLSLIIKSCNVCKANCTIPKKDTNEVGLVYVTVMLQSNEFPIFKYLLIYIDKATDFVVLRPLKQNSDVEVAMEIFKILMQFGPPKKLCFHGYNKNFNKRVGSILREVCPVLTFSIEYKSANFDTSSFVVDKLQNWMTSNNCTFWEIGCSVIQKELNDTVNKQLNTGKTARNTGITSLSPHELFYGKFHPLKKNEEELHKQTKVLTESSETTRERETIAVDNKVVELRIPSPENYELDLLNQFEDSQIRQGVPAVDNILSVDRASETNAIDHEVESKSIDLGMSVVRITDEPKSLVPSQMKETGGKVTSFLFPSSLSNKEVNKKDRSRMQTSSPKHTTISSADSEILLLQMECEDENQNEETNEENDNLPNESRKMSLRSAKIDINREKSPEYEIEEEEMVYNPDDINVEDAKDPFEDVEIPDSVDFS